MQRGVATRARCPPAGARRVNRTCIECIVAIQQHSLRMRGRPPGSDADVVLDEVYASKFRDGKIVELREYRTKSEALEAVGLPE